MFEWFAICHVLQVQKDRSIGEILYQHNAENINASMHSDQQFTYKREEKRLHIKMKWFLGILIIFEMFCYFMMAFYPGVLISEIFLFIICVIQVV